MLGNQRVERVFSSYWNIRFHDLIHTHTHTHNNFKTFMPKISAKFSAPPKVNFCELFQNQMKLVTLTEMYYLYYLY